MCWSAEVSLQSFGIGIVAVVLAVYKGLSIPSALFCLTIVFMQLVEYFVWSNYDNPIINYRASLAAIALLWLQPVASILTLPTAQIPLFLGAYIVLAILGIFLGFTTPKEHIRMYRGSNGHLVWDWIQDDYKTYIPLVFYFLFLFTPLFLSQEFLLLSISLVTLLISLVSYYQYNTWGSMWCWIVNYLVVGVSIKQVLSHEYTTK